MKALFRTKQELLVEISALQQKINELGQLEVKHKLVEDALKESEEYAKSLFTSSHIPLIVMDAETAIITDCNAAAVKIYGFATREELLGKTPLEMSALIQYDGSDSATAVKKHIQACCKKGSHIFEWRHQRSNGQIWDADVQLMLLQHRGKAFIQFKVQDITERKHAENTLRKSEQEKSAILDAITELVIYLDTDLKIIRSNSALLQQFNLQADQVEGKYCFNVLHGLNRPCRICPVLRTIETGEPYTINNFSSLGKRWFMRSYPAKEGEKLVGIVETVIDVTERQIMADALRESEDKYRKIFEGATEGIYQTSPEGRYLRMNPAFARMFGFASPQEMIDYTTNIGQQLYVNPKDREEMVRMLRERDKVDGYEVEVYRKDRSRFWISINSHAVRDPAGNILYFEGTNIDITKRKQAEEALRASEDKYRRLTEDMPAFVSTFLPDGTLTYVNNVLAAWDGMPNTEIVGNNIFTFISAEDCEKVNVQLASLTPEQSVETHEQHYIREGREIFHQWINRAFFDSRGRITHFQAIGFDITERKKMEAALKESDERFRALFDGSRDCVFIHDLEGTILDLNQAVFDLMGCDRNNFLSLNYASFLDKEQNVKVRQIIDELLRTGFQQKPLEIKVKRKDGSYLNFESRSSVIHRNGKPYAIIVISRDITSRKREEKELARYREQLEELVKERTADLESKNIALQDLNTALTVLLKKREEDKKVMEETLNMNIQSMVLPYVGQLKQGRLDACQRTKLQIIETLLQDISAPLMKNLRQFNLTPKEIKVATLVRQGKPTKEIAEALGIAKSSVDDHRKNIRKKLGLDNKKENLQLKLEALE